MTDEQRRRLEREARYDEKLAGLLQCLRDGHDPLPQVEGYDTRNLLAVEPHIRASDNRAHVVRGCARCGLAYVEVVRGRQAGAVVVTALAPVRTRVPDPTPRAGMCRCGHWETQHSDLGWRGRCLYTTGFDAGAPCSCQRYAWEGDSR